MTDLFGLIREFPDAEARRRFDALVGLDLFKERLVSEGRVLLDPRVLESWSETHHKKVLPAVGEFAERTPLFILAGDVGTGKTELAETVGDAIARALNATVTLFPLSLSARGRGAVGEMTTLLTSAFAEVRSYVASGRDSKGKLHHAAVLLVDEADTLAQSRELTQMHHEDRAGVNALIRGVDELRRDGLPVVTIMCTNRAEAIDPAVTRRAAAIFGFQRPDDEQRRILLTRAFDGVELTEPTMKQLVRLLGPNGERDYGCTHSDVRQRFIPEAILDALDGRPIVGKRLVELARGFEPTRPFTGAANA